LHQGPEARLERLEALVAKGLANDNEARSALLGAVKKPAIQLSDLFVEYEAMTKDEVRDLSPDQRRIWQNGRKRAVERFVDIAGDKPITEITQEDGMNYCEWWRSRVIDGEAARFNLLYLRTSCNVGLVTPHCVLPLSTVTSAAQRNARSQQECGVSQRPLCAGRSRVLRDAAFRLRSLPSFIRLSVVRAMSAVLPRAAVQRISRHFRKVPCCHEETSHPNRSQSALGTLHEPVNLFLSEDVHEMSGLRHETISPINEKIRKQRELMLLASDEVLECPFPYHFSLQELGHAPT